VQILKLFPLGGGLIIAQATFEVIVLKVKAGRTAEAKKLAKGLIDFTTNRFAAGVLFQQQSQQTLDKVTVLTSSLQCFLGLPQAVPQGATDVVAAVVTKTTPDTVIKTPQFRAGVLITKGDVSQPTLITIYQTPVAVPETLLTNLDQFGPYYQFTSSGGSFNTAVLTGICTDGSGSSLRLAHNVPDPAPTTIEILPLQNTDALGLDCESLALGPSLNMGNFASRGLRTLGNEISRLLSPEPLSAAVKTGTGVGSTTKNFSTFGVVDAVLPMSYGASGYRYMITGSEPVGWQTLGFDDGSWSLGTAAFGNANSICPAIAPNVHTSWPAAASGHSTYILLRKSFGVPAGSTRSLQINVAIDNDIQVFVNDTNITATGGTPDADGFIKHEGCATNDSYSFVASSSILVPGAVNVIAVRARDRGVESYVDLQASLFGSP
jgi:hypothetical protein